MYYTASVSREDLDPTSSVWTWMGLVMSVHDLFIGQFGANIAKYGIEPALFPSHPTCARSG